MTSKTPAEIMLAPLPEGITFRMPAADRQKWLDGLRSGYYKQGMGMLQTGNHKYCCLGVCQMVVDGDVERQKNHPKESEGLPSLDWYKNHGVYEKDPGYDDNRVRSARTLNVLYKHPVNDTEPTRWPLHALNDTVKLSFADIADLIEKHSEGY